MEYNFKKDLKAIRSILELSQSEFAKQIEVEQATISRNESGQTKPSAKLLEDVYSFAFDKNIKLNNLKEMLFHEEISASHKLLFHGAKSTIEGKPNVNRGRANNDFGKGFYTGESYDQAVSFVSGFSDSSVYFIDFNFENLECKKYEVNQEWMMTIAYYRGTLDSYKEHPIIKDLIEKSRECDYIIAPIADNRMFRIINSFIDGEITDEQCKHCLAATNLGMQYIFVSDKAMSQAKIIERCYIPENEREYYMNIRSQDAKLGDDKVKLARIQYRGKGHYIDELLK